MFPLSGVRTNTREEEKQIFEKEPMLNLAAITIMIPQSINPKSQ